MIRAASSRFSAPATTAAANSPWEWPTTADGVTPSASQTAAREIITAHSTGWMISTCSVQSVQRDSVSGPLSSSVSRHSTKGARAASHSAIRAANTGLARRSSRPMPSHCEPCPGNTNVTPAAGLARPVTTSPAGASVPSARERAVPTGSGPRRTARCSRAARRVSRAKETSAGSVPGSRPVSDSWSVPDRRAVPDSRSARRAAWARSASASRAESVHGGVPPRQTGSPAMGAGSDGTSSGASRMTCALVPLIPNEETPARRARPVSGQGVASVSRATSPLSQSTCAVGVSTCRVFGSTPCRIASTILITPVTPAAAWV